MRAIPTAFLSLGALLLLAAPARPDVVTTRGGLVLEGTVEKAADGSLVVATEDGSVRLSGSDVLSVTPGEGPRAKARRESAAIPATDTEGHFRLAVRLEAQGLSDLARREYEAVLAADADHAAARRALGYEKVAGAWLSAADAQRAKGLVLFDGKWVLPAEAEARARDVPPVTVRDLGLVATMRLAATGEAALARAAAVSLLSADEAKRHDTATALLLDKDAKVRAWAASHLGAIGDERALRPLLVSAVRDPDADVRKAAILSAASFGNDDVPLPLARGLDSRHPGIVANSARALATLGDPRGITWLVKKITMHGSSGRVVVESLTKTSYVRDYDVEIAQAANIANPIVGTVMEGIVLDVKVLDASVEQTMVMPVLVDSFNTLAGASARSADDVAAWWKEHGANVPRFPEAPGPRRVRPTKAN